MSSEAYDVEDFGAVIPSEADAPAPKALHLPEQITKGKRHDLIRKLLRSQKARGISFEAAKATCDIENQAKCDPKLEVKDLEYQRWWDQPDQPGFDDKRRVEFIRASEVKVEKIDWLWRARLARGALTLFEGGPERGKSTVLVDISARVSRGHSFPNETDTRDPANVVMLIAEDDLGATVVPRLIAAGADLTRVFFLFITTDARGDVVPFHLSDDCARLREQCQEVGDVALVVVDPLVSFMGSRTGRTLNTYNDMEVRKALAPLKDLAESLRVAVAAIRHYRKGSSTDAMEAGGGSVAFAALVRVIIAALPDPNDATTYLLAVAKNNLVKKSNRPALAYSIVPATADPDIGCIAWGATVDMSANEILAAQAEADKNNSGKVAEAKQFLETFLASGAWFATTDIVKAADAHGIKKHNLDRAKAVLGIDVEKRKDKWGWMLTPM